MVKSLCDCYIARVLAFLILIAARRCLIARYSAWEDIKDALLKIPYYSPPPTTQFSFTQKYSRSISLFYLYTRHASRKVDLSLWISNRKCIAIIFSSNMWVLPLKKELFEGKSNIGEKRLWMQRLRNKKKGENVCSTCMLGEKECENHEISHVDFTMSSNSATSWIIIDVVRWRKLSNFR